MRWIILLIIFLGSCKPGNVKNSESSLLLKLDRLIISEHDSNRFDGVIIIGNADSVIFHKAVGIADRVWNISMHPDCRFDIASINKSFIAVLILKAVEEGRLNLMDKLPDLFQNFQYDGKFNPDITLHHMLTHTSGLPDYEAVGKELSEEDFLKFKRLHFTNSEYVDFISRLDPLFSPGEKFYYSNFAYHLLAIILEDIYKKDFGDLLQEKICVPLHLNQTFSTVSNQEVQGKIVEAYQFDDKTGEWQRNHFIDLTLGRRIFSSVQDLYKWGKAMTDTTFLTARSISLMLTNHLTDITNELSYGYGWVIFDGNGQYIMGNLSINEPYFIHGGATEGYRSMLVNIQNGKWIIAFLSNIGDRTDEMSLSSKIVQILTETSNEN